MTHQHTSLLANKAGMATDCACRFEVRHTRTLLCGGVGSDAVAGTGYAATCFCWLVGKDAFDVMTVIVDVNVQEVQCCNAVAARAAWLVPVCLVRHALVGGHKQRMCADFNPCSLHAN
jgi:hypothetical protein